MSDDDKRPFEFYGSDGRLVATGELPAMYVRPVIIVMEGSEWGVLDGDARDPGPPRVGEPNRYVACLQPLWLTNVRRADSRRDAIPGSLDRSYSPRGKSDG